MYRHNTRTSSTRVLQRVTQARAEKEKKRGYFFNGKQQQTVSWY